jgi:tricorn protease
VRYTKRLWLWSMFLLPTALSAQSVGIPRYPHASRTEIVFQYDGKLWLVPRTGGLAKLLRTDVAVKRQPRFSSDGNTIAFIGAHDGIYTIPAVGGPVQRLTHLPGTTDLCGWTPDGKLLFMTDAFSFVFDADDQARVRQLYVVSADGGLPSKLPLRFGANGSISPDGDWLAYTLYAEGPSEHRKHYRGGFAPDIWLLNLRAGNARPLTTWAGTDTDPMWHGRRVYYLSDAGAEKRRNIWFYDTRDSKRVQVTHFRDYDVKWPAMGTGRAGDGEITLINGADVYLIDLATEAATRVSIEIPNSRVYAAERQRITVGNAVTHPRFATAGELVAEARGDVWVVPQTGMPRNLTSTTGTAERESSPSPDGRWIAYFADTTGEYELYVRRADSRGGARQLTRIGPGFRYAPTWSPDSQWLAFHDSDGTIYLCSIADARLIKIDQDPLRREPHLSWSPDSKWVAYARGAAHSPRFTAIWIYNLGANATRQVTSGWFDDSWPTFDAGGEYLFFVTARSPSSVTFDTYDHNNFIYPAADVLVAVPLRGGIPSPWTSRAEPHITSSVEIDFVGFEHRALILSRDDRGAISNLVSRRDRLLYALRPSQGSAVIKALDFAAGRKQSQPVVQTLLTGVAEFQVSLDGQRLAFLRDGKIAVTDGAGNSLSGFGTEQLSATIDPRREWQQMFDDAWRIYRDFFYDASMRGVDWMAIRKQYARLLPSVGNRDDLDYVIGEMAGELGSSHVFVFHPSTTPESREAIGMLGVDFEFVNGAYRFRKIHDAGPADTFGRNPLTRGGDWVREGDYLIAVNGKAMDPRQDPWAAFIGLAGKDVVLTVSSHPTLDSIARNVTVRARSEDNFIRNRAWVEANRAYVDSRSDGQIGYIYLATTEDYGSQEFTRQLNGQLGKRALIVDARWNEGGYAPFHIIDVLARRTQYLFFQDRRRPVGGRTPDYITEGPVTMLINAVSYSGGDMLPYFFRQRGIGTLVGSRTMGGMVGAGAHPNLIDGGAALVPYVGFYDFEGQWVVEGTGVSPDVEVIDSGAEAERDPQLEQAIANTVARMRQFEYKPAVAPPRPSRSIR